jgi:hypothetical protein
MICISCGKAGQSDRRGARAELIETARKIAAESNFDRMEFVSGKIAEADMGPADIVTALHACDTATDEATSFALRHEASSWRWCPAARRKWRASWKA